MAERNPSDFARLGAKAANAARSPEERRKLSRRANRALWKGHVKKKKPGALCMCKGCKGVRARAIKNKKKVSA